MNTAQVHHKIPVEVETYSKLVECIYAQKIIGLNYPTIEIFMEALATTADTGASARPRHYTPYSIVLRLAGNSSTVPGSIAVSYVSESEGDLFLGRIDQNTLAFSPTKWALKNCRYLLPNVVTLLTAANVKQG